MRAAIIFLLMMSTGAAFGQVSLSASSGLGFYAMGEMGSFQEQVRASMTVDARNTATFPAYWFYEVSVKNDFRGLLMAGATFTYGSTGGRTYYSDYSGDLGSDQLLKYYTYTLNLGIHRKLNAKGIYLQADLKPGMTQSSLKLSSYETIGKSSDEQAFNFKSVSWNVQPTFTLTKRFGPAGINIFAGYFITLVSGKLTTSNGSGGYLHNSTGSPVHADWSGLRLGIGASYYFGNGKVKE